MRYALLYDIRHEPPFEPQVAWLAAAVVGLGFVWFLWRKRQGRSPTTGYVLMGFGSVIALVGVGLMSWDHQRLVSAMERGEAQVVEGPVLSWSKERQRTRRSNGGYDSRTYERFYIGHTVWFGYYWEVGQAGFHNQTTPPIDLHNGLLVRATYLYADGRDQPPRIVRLEHKVP